MSDGANLTPPAGGNPPPAPPADGGNPPPAPPAPAQRPEWLPEAHWDGEAKSIKLDDFGKHYSEIATAHKTFTEQQAALAARKPEDVKIEIKLPDGVEVPTGYDLKADEKHPLAEPARQIVLKHHLPQEVMNDFAAAFSAWQITKHNDEQARVAEQDKALGANAKTRKDAVGGWFKGMLERGDITKEEYSEATVLTTEGVTITLFEKLMAKATGAVPGAGAGAPPSPPKPADLPIEKRWYGDQQKAS